MVKKAKNQLVTLDYLKNRIAGLTKAGWPKSKWMKFCEILLEKGYSLRLYEAKETRSKYITVSKDGREGKDGREFKVRFSDHLPNQIKQADGDCDFYVGKSHGITTNTTQALEATIRFFCNS